MHFMHCKLPIGPTLGVHLHLPFHVTEYYREYSHPDCQYHLEVDGFIQIT